MAALPKSVEQDPRFREIKTRRAHAAAKARGAQAAYRRCMSAFVLATALSALLGGLLLLGFEASGERLEEGGASAGLVAQFQDLAAVYRTPLGILQALALGAAAVFAFLLNESRFAAKWIANRTKAEADRGVLYRTALEVAHGQGPEVFAHTGRYVYEAFVQGQMSYLRKAAADHESRSSRLALVGALVLGLGVVASSLGSLGSPSLVVIAAFLGVMSPALLAGVKSWREMSFDRERSSLHETTLHQLSPLSADAARLTQAADDGDLTAALEYVDEVIAVLTGDTQAFVNLAANATKAPAVPAANSGAG
ncbi:hypothetical protein [Roseobacter sinensis]|uniref:Uncharacterized protein n=1 Tax=Roseobacter sinensis TaxID=2931391 RepID=A0ABT3BHY5_9RHOB|nr:hypothetical protein [Roseobacter sp. WL0113]MCV3272813.1 hypothetical protein [Roseobacter sp. WL0113]